jgi:hypothetical protein
LEQLIKRLLHGSRLVFYTRDEEPLKRLGRNTEKLLYSRGIARFIGDPYENVALQPPP